MTDSDDDDPLKSLEIDRNQYDRKRMAKALEELVAIDNETGDPIILDSFQELDSRRQISALLLAKRAAHALEHIEEDEVGMKSSEIAERTNVAGSTVRRYASDKLSFISNDNGIDGYYIPRTKIGQAVDFITAAKDQ
ncbi:helix-turn-helix domain-containing protein [Haloarcula hispanica]|uniref:Helix-turn-helix domain-containing protein n=2 Tax=Haloarcula TaxID=2237 RepID=A0A847UAE8_9EURY|nr:MULTISPECIES: helix-turn-helix domain-containing protein [Haloarcula]MCJ0621385.1 helix-turn-helix domain-containing protein [Haloarcula hispanica]NLV08194.1 helix-turn-helix domain-containing protein [Haloarcula rubripromontorii]RYJ07700.1 hypothetical protein ELS20_18250 [Haloarcula hispanica]